MHVKTNLIFEVDNYEHCINMIHNYFLLTLLQVISSENMVFLWSVLHILCSSVHFMCENVPSFDFCYLLTGIFGSFHCTRQTASSHVCPSQFIFVLSFLTLSFFLLFFLPQHFLTYLSSSLLLSFSKSTFEELLSFCLISYHIQMKHCQSLSCSVVTSNIFFLLNTCFAMAILVISFMQSISSVT